MRVIELTGPTGAGKSAIYAEMLKFGGFAPNPSISPQEALAIINAGVAKHPETADFMSFLAWVFRTAEDHDGRLTKRESGTLRALAKLYMARASADPQFMVVDGGLIHRGQGIDRLHPKMPVHRYFELMPLPDYVFAVWCQPEVLAQRNQGRGGSHDRTADLERQWACHNLGLDIFKRRGAKIVTVDTTTFTPEKAAQAILVRLGLIRKYDGDHAKNYEADRKSKKKWDAEQRIIEAMLGDLPMCSWVLDAPCGTGRFFEFYDLNRFIVRGLDKEADMIAQAGKKITNPTAMVGDVAQWKFIHGDVRDTKLPDKSVDVSVNCRITRWLSPEGCVAMLREMQRVVRKRIIWTARVAHYDQTIARPISLFESALDGWRITRKEEVEPNYYILAAEPV